MTESNILTAAGAALIAAWTVLKTYWNLREIGRDRARAKAAGGRGRS